jgi:hypothetical protein
MAVCNVTMTMNNVGGWDNSYKEKATSMELKQKNKSLWETKILFIDCFDTKNE